MARKRRVAAGGAAAAAAAAVAAGVVAERRVVKERRAGAGTADKLGSLHTDPVVVTASDGVPLHAEVEDGPGPTIVFVHGYALNLDCWHYQRAALRGRHRMVFYDQRSHGRSGRSDREHANIDQLGDDLAAVLASLGGRGKVVLAGHSMGGMSVMAFAKQHPEMFAERVRAVALISTSAGGLRPHRTVGGRWIPDRIGVLVLPRLLAVLSRAPELIDSARRAGSNVGYLVAREFAFGDDSSSAQVEFVDQMLAATPIDVVAEFFPSFESLDLFDVLTTFATLPTAVVCGTEDKITPISHTRRLAAKIPGVRKVECAGAGHMVILEQHQVVTSLIEDVAGG